MEQTEIRKTRLRVFWLGDTCPFRAVYIWWLSTVTTHLHARVATLRSDLRSAGGPNGVLEDLFQTLFKTCNTSVYT